LAKGPQVVGLGSPVIEMAGTHPTRCSGEGIVGAVDVVDSWAARARLNAFPPPAGRARRMPCRGAVGYGFANEKGPGHFAPGL
jgi:hypothetical protein